MKVNVAKGYTKEHWERIELMKRIFFLIKTIVLSSLELFFMLFILIYKLVICGFIIGTIIFLFM